MTDKRRLKQYRTSIGERVNDSPETSFSLYSRLKIIYEKVGEGMFTKRKVLIKTSVHLVFVELQFLTGILVVSVSK